MRSAKSTNSLANQTKVSAIVGHSTLDRRRAESSIISKSQVSETTSPICRCRVMYLGSSVPHITKDGLQGIQEPLRELYPDRDSIDSGNAGIDSWLSVWSNGILIENIDESGHGVKRFFKIEALHYCAAVKYVPLSQQQQQDEASQCSDGAGELNSLPRFLPLDSPHAQLINSSPPIFASIIRRTTGIKVLECHAFVCKREAAANALVRCCFHAYADTMYAKQIGADVNGLAPDLNNNAQTPGQGAAKLARQPAYDIPDHQSAGQHRGRQLELVPGSRRRSKSIAALNEASDDNWRNQQELASQRSARRSAAVATPHDRNHATQVCDTDGDPPSEALRRQQKLSKSMHQLSEDQSCNRLLMQQSQLDAPPYATANHHSASVSCLSQGATGNGNGNNNSHHQVPHHPQPFYNQQQAARVPSYPPQSLIDVANNGGTLRSIKSMAANSIASTLLRSKKHAKAMSMAQLNQQQHDQQILANCGVTSFHQPHSKQAKAAATMGGHGSHGMALGMHHQLMMPPVPPMFLPNLPANLLNGSQTMKPLSKSATMLPYAGPPINGFGEPLSQKEIKKLLKKSSKYGIDPARLVSETNGLPVPLMRPSQQSMMAAHMGAQPTGALKGKGTAAMQPPPPLVLPEMYASAELQSELGAMPPPPPLPFEQLAPPGAMMEPMALKPILVKPNPEFLKSKAGKKWLKQQKEFKKLLPPHLDGLPIIFGPPPPDALEPGLPLPPPPPPHAQQGAMFMPNGQIPVMDSAGYYNPHPFYGHVDRASAASTLVRHSPGHEMGDFAERGMFPRHYHPGHSLGGHLDSRYGNSRSSISSSTMANSHRDYYASELEAAASGQQRGLSLEKSGRRHMVEQSVISLGDENDDCDDDDGDQQGSRQADEFGGSSDEQQPSGGPQTPNANGNQPRAHQPRSSQAPSYQTPYEHQQQSDYEQIRLGAGGDEQEAEYSSGIYKRGHLNERAFSHSIRQELGNGTCSRLQTEGSEFVDHAARNGLPPTEPDRGHRQHYQSNPPPHHHHHGQQQQQHNHQNNLQSHHNLSQQQQHQLQLQMQQNMHMQMYCHAMDASKPPPPRLARNDGHANPASHLDASLQMLNSKRDQNDDYYASHHNGSGGHFLANQNHSISDSSCNGNINDPINELTHRLDNQLNLKSFSNSRIRSHM